MSEALRSILLGTAGLTLAAVLSAVLTVRRGNLIASQAERVALIRLTLLTTLLQTLHFSEELATGFERSFPALLGLPPWPLEFFVPFNLGWIALWAASAVALNARSHVALFPIWFLGIGGLLNGFAHPAFAIQVGGYFPGLASSPVVGVAGFLLLRSLARLTGPLRTRRHASGDPPEEGGVA